MNHGGGGRSRKSSKAGKPKNSKPVPVEVIKASCPYFEEANRIHKIIK